jgi:hypothetical protein
MMAAICALMSFSVFAGAGAAALGAALDRHVRFPQHARKRCKGGAPHPAPAAAAPCASSRCTSNTHRSSGSRDATAATTSTSLCRQPSISQAVVRTKKECVNGRGSTGTRVGRRRRAAACPSAGAARRPDMTASLGARRPAWSCRARSRAQTTPPGTGHAGTECCERQAKRCVARHVPPGGVSRERAPRLRCTRRIQKVGRTC